jgi:D-inositol-3-phosphate glycosyltransferase
VTIKTFTGPSVFGYETDTLRRVASISVHTSPLATLGGKDAGGMNVYVRELACHVADLGLPVDIFTRRTDPDTPETARLCPGVNVVSITAGPPEPVDKNQLFQYLPDFARESALYALRNGLRYDVMHAHYWLSGWTAHLLRRYWEAPFIQMFHTTAHMKNAVAGAHQQETDLRGRIERKLVHLADSVIAANPDERADLIWRQRTPTNKVCTVPPGVDLYIFTTHDRDACRQQLGIAPAERAILFVGRIDPIKGIDTLLTAMQQLNDGAVRPLLVFIGGDLDSEGNPAGPLADVVALAEELGVADRIRFEGSQPQDRLPVYYSAADVVAVPSRYESFGLVAVEAMACGVPVVASRAGGLIFTVDEDATGYLVPPSDPTALAGALSRVLSDPALRARLSETALERVQRFSWSVVAAQILHVYQRLADGYRADLCCDEDLYA